MRNEPFVRSEMLAQETPPLVTTGPIGWVRGNLFNGVWNSLLTVVLAVIIVWLLGRLLPWIFAPTWNADSLATCREIIAGLGREHGAACWGVVNERWRQLLFGFYPEELRWRPILAFALLFIALIPMLFSMVSRRMTWFLLAAVLFLATFYGPWSFVNIVAKLVTLAAAAYFLMQVLAVNKSDREEQIKQGAKRLPSPLLFSALYPFIAVWLLWGGTIWGPLLAALGFVLGFLAHRFTAPVIGNLGGVILAFLVPIIWWLFITGPLAAGLGSLIPLGIETVESRNFGGFLLSVTIGVTAIAISLPLGIVLALARQSDLLIVKSLSVGFIEFIRGVPLITLLFVASTLLNIFMPPGTNFDIILRVIIMATLFSSAYMAEVIRGGLAALPRGQYEGADSLGLDYWQAQRLIIMPQALKISIPGIVSTFIGLFKDTTLVSIIGLLDPIGLSNAIRADVAWNGIVWELYGFIAFVFFIFCFSMSRYSMYLERRLRTDHR